MTVERYRAFGLEIASEIELSVFAPGRSNEVDVEIRLAEQLSDPEEAEAMQFRNWIARPGLMVLDVPDVARFRIEDGRRILVEPAKGRTPADAVPHVQGSALAALLQQRRTLPMHAGAIETSRGAMLLVGTSGVGKSTLTNAFVQRAYRMMGDDVTPVSLDAAGRPMATSGFPASRLWADSAAYFGHDTSRLRRAQRDLEKYYVVPENWCDARLPVAVVVILHVAGNGQPRIEPLEPAERMKWLLRYSFRKKFLNGFGLNDIQFRMVSAMAAQSQMVRLVRPARGAPAADLAALLEEALGFEPVAEGERLDETA